MKISRLILTLSLTAGLASTASGAYNKAYYQAMDGLRKESLKQAAKQCVTKHTVLEYSGLPGVWIDTDVYPERYDGQLRWWEMYSNNIYVIKNNQSAFQSFSGYKMQREHAIPKSWWKKNNDVEYTPAYSDLWNLYPSDGEANMAKSNYPFAPVRSATFDNGLTKVGPPVSGYGGSAPMAFEPGDEYKGDFARTIFYMATVYDELPWVYGWMFMPNSTWPTLRDWAYNMLLQWARQDPVSQKEIDRNNAVERKQGNRNPFIDFPELAEYIWGVRTSETFYIDQQGNTLPPPISGEAELTMPVNGSSLDFGQSALGHTVSSALEVAGANLTSALTVSITGADKGLFRVETKSISNSQINSGATYLLQIFYTPDKEGKHSAYLALYDGGLPDGQSVRVQLIGEGCAVPTLSRLSALPATEITAESYRANWGVAPEIVDYYIVNRTRYVADGQEAEIIQANTNSALIEGRDEDVAESYTVSSVRLGLVSEPSNEILVASGSGVNEVSEGSTHFVASEDGITVITTLESVDVIVFDLHGRLVTSEKASNGSRITLPSRGLYLIAVPGAAYKKIIL